MPFGAHCDPTPAQWAELAELDPANPFCSTAYIQAMRKLGHSPCVLSVRSEGRLITACAGFTSQGRLNRALFIRSLPPECDESFWQGVLAFCEKQGMTYLHIGTAASCRVSIPRFREEIERSDRWEYVLDLQEGELWDKLHENHRRRVRKASKQGVTVGRAEDSAQLAAHGRLMSQSLDRRRQRGESVPAAAQMKTIGVLLQEGAGTMFQAARGSEILSSIVLLLAKRGAYLHSSGTNPEGMDMGASHLLQHEVAKQLRDQGMQIYNLGGSEQPDSGLAIFKRRFGTRVNQLQTVEAFVGRGLRARLGKLARELGQPRREKSQATSANGQPVAPEMRGAK